MLPVVELAIAEPLDDELAIPPCPPSPPAPPLVLLPSAELEPPTEEVVGPADDESSELASVAPPVPSSFPAAQLCPNATAPSIPPVRKTSADRVAAECPDLLKGCRNIVSTCT
jgi:hypothetical protein